MYTVQAMFNKLVADKSCVKNDRFLEKKNDKLLVFLGKILGISHITNIDCSDNWKCSFLANVSIFFIEMTTACFDCLSLIFFCLRF